VILGWRRVETFVFAVDGHNRRFRFLSWHLLFYPGVFFSPLVNDQEKTPPPPERILLAV
jgi:hypothetical protein